MDYFEGVGNTASLPRFLRIYLDFKNDINILSSVPKIIELRSLRYIALIIKASQISGMPFF